MLLRKMKIGDEVVIGDTRIVVIGMSRNKVKLGFVSPKQGASRIVFLDKRPSTTDADRAFINDVTKQYV